MHEAVTDFEAFTIRQKPVGLLVPPATMAITFITRQSLQPIQSIVAYRPNEMTTLASTTKQIRIRI